MRPWDLDTSAAQLRKAMEDLQEAWQITEEQWRDPVSQKFLESHLEPIVPAVKQTLEAVGQIQQLVNQMQKELNDETLISDL